MHRTAPRLARILACAAVPVMLVASGCSSDPDSKPKAEKSSTTEKTGNSGGAPLATPEAEKKPVIAPVKFAKLPDACKSIPSKTVKELVPSAKSSAGTAGRSTDLLVRASCSWNGLEDKGVKGSQYRWLDVSFLRYESDAALATSGKQRAQESYTKEIAKTRTTAGAKAMKSAPATGVGEEATTLTYQIRKTGVDFSYVTIVTRTDNILITLTYNGTGYAGAKPPAVADLLKDAVPAAKETVTAVSAANK
ncbi:DUF3558 domain-containing protein [Streptomyces sp. NPDC056500]|uniref:DUF3558 domain-containing protein n=1 Tax=Streptomyces sp. NPDC056500 TaxID=3345840 RepID=UPI0036B77269